MNRIYLIFLLAVPLYVSISTCSDETQPLPDKSPVFLGDPYILVDDGTYYMYGTGQDSDTGISVYKSDNLKTWEGPVGAVDGFALHKQDVYGDRWYWAPEVYQIDDLYYMFFSVEEHMAVATSESPLGPFTQQEKSTLTNFKAIDHSLFVDDDGTYYLYFAKFEEGLETWVAEIEEDFSSIREGTMQRVVSRSQDWERSLKDPVGIVNEGAQVIKHEDMYYMIYSANHYASQDYGIGLAYADHPMGPWTKQESNPILQNPDDRVGTGHSMIFEGTDGQLYMAYHAHFDQTNVHPRAAYINPVEFVYLEDENRYTLSVQEPLITPEVRTSE